MGRTVRSSFSCAGIAGAAGVSERPRTAKAVTRGMVVRPFLVTRLSLLVERRGIGPKVYGPRWSRSPIAEVGMYSRRISWALLTLALLAPAAGRAWIYSEHRDIAAAAVAKLPAGEREKLEGIWTKVRSAIPGRLCEHLSAGDQGTKPDCIDFAAWAAIAGD